MPLYVHHDSEGRYAGNSQSLGFMLLRWGPIGWFLYAFFVLAFAPVYVSYKILMSGLDPMWKLLWIGVVVAIVAVLAVLG